LQTENSILQKITSQSEINAAAKLAADIWAEHYTPIIGKQQVDYMVANFQSPQAISEQIKNGYEYYFIKSLSENAGYIAIDYKDDGSLFLSKLYIAKAFRGKGLAKKAVNEIIGFAKQKNCSRIWLTVNKNNSGSIAAYNKLGFKQVDAVVSDIGGGFVMDDYIMQLNLEDN